VRRQEISPLPYCPPMMNPPFFKPGKTATQWARSSKSWGMPWSGASMIWVKACAASLVRSRASVFGLAVPAEERQKRRTKRVGTAIFRMSFSRRMMYHSAFRSGNLGKVVLPRP